MQFAQELEDMASCRKKGSSKVELEGGKEEEGVGKREEH